MNFTGDHDEIHLPTLTSNLNTTFSSESDLPSNIWNFKLNKESFQELTTLPKKTVLYQPFYGESFQGLKWRHYQYVTKLLHHTVNKQITI